MTDHAGLRLSLGSYLAGVLDAAARGELEAHLHHCDACRSELAELSALPRLLARLTPAELDEGPLTPPASLLPGLLSRAHEAQTGARRRLWRWRAAAAALGAAAVVVVVLPTAAPPTPAGRTYQLHPTAAVAGIGGQVTLARKPWGTELALSLRGLPPGTACVAVVSGRDGQTEVVGNWGPTANHVAKVLVATGLPSDRLASVAVKTVAGRSLLSVDVTA